MFIPTLAVVGIIMLLGHIASRMPDKPRSMAEIMEDQAKTRASLDRSIARMQADVKRLEAKAKRKAEGKGLLHWIATGE